MSSLDSAAEDEEGPISALNIVPFVDVILVLLVIFMLTSTTIARNSLKVELPKAATAAARVKATLDIVCTKEDRIFVDGQLVPSLAATGEIVAQRVRANPATQAVIAADKAVSYGRIVEVIDLVKGNGVSAFALDVERGPRQGAARGTGLP